MIFLFLHISFVFIILMIFLSFYLSGSQVQLTRILAQIPEIHQPDDIFLFIIEMKKIVTPEQMEEAVFTDDKQTREKNIDEVTEKMAEAFADNEEWLAVLGEAVYQYQKKTVRKMILKDHKRPDGRAINQIRPLAAEVDIIPRVHGSAMFTRGQTQICDVVTLAPLSEAQKVDGLDDNVTTKRYIHQYNFPSYSVGETKPSRGPGRREIGHGALAEKALVPVLPSEERYRVPRHLSHFWQSDKRSCLPYSAPSPVWQERW